MSLPDVRSGVRRVLPGSLLRLIRRRRIEALRRQNRERSVAEIFEDIYRDNRWGGEDGTLHSGSGSSDVHARQYARAIRSFIEAHEVRHVVDLGCGDFRVGARLVKPQLPGADLTYTGIDIVERVVHANRRRYGSERVGFACLDIIADELPPGDLCLLRQVLQHLSNDQIHRVLRNVERYRHVIVTEHHPAPAALRAKNLDKPCGEDVRIYDGSGVFLDAPPFNLRVSRVLLDVEAGQCLMHRGERLRSYLIENFAAASAPQGG